MTEVGSLESGGRPFRVLVVCTANICRSPMAAHYISVAAAEAGHAVEVSSAGFLFDGRPASCDVQTVMSERGIDLGAHRSRIATEEMVESVDLVATMERRHARDLATLVPAAVSRIHTLGALVTALEDTALEDTALEDTALEDTDGESLGPGQRLHRVAAVRSASDLLGEGSDEIEDPYGRSLRANRQAADRLWDLAQRVVAGLFVIDSD